METTTINYICRRECKCGNVDVIKVDKISAAFELRDEEIWNLKCTKCDSKEIASIVNYQPKIDRELLTIWSENEEYRFCDQDEDITLAQYEENIDLYLEFIDNEMVPEVNKKILIVVLCIMIYDRAGKNDSEENLIVKKIAKELKKRESRLINCKNWVMDYIKEISFPIIGIK